MLNINPAKKTKRIIFGNKFLGYEVIITILGTWLADC